MVTRSCSRIPENLRGIETVLIIPVMGLLVSGSVMYLLLAPLATLNAGLVSWLNSLDVAGLVVLGLLLAGMMAVDLGGPVNKTAFTLGLVAIEAGNYLPHAAVMAGGMVPPIALGLATHLFSNRCSGDERKAGKRALVLGASFIAEGAIPFVAADPARVLPACIAGSALAGGVSMFFGCQLMVPHGGIFVVPLMQNPALYLLAMAAGALLTVMILGFVKKPLS